MTREARIPTTQARIFALLDNKQNEIIEFVLSKYNETGVEELIFTGNIPKKQASPKSPMEIMRAAASCLNHGFKGFKDFTV